jgi:hypothetical protein
LVLDRTTLSDNENFGDHKGDTSRRLFELIFIFVTAFLVLFLAMNLSPNIYDESLILVGAMRVQAGQIPHRDFYANYGPAQFYVLAGLFRLFGQSILVERFYDLVVKALLVTLIYRTLLDYCRRSVALGAAFVAALWIVSLAAMTGTPTIPLSLLSLVGSLLILPVFVSNVSAGRLLLAGVISGIATLFRYDVGIALIGVHAGALAFAGYGRFRGGSARVRDFSLSIAPYLAGAALVLLPTALWYVSASVTTGFFHDLVQYPSKYYHRGRNLPFPRITLKGFDTLNIYVLPVVGVLALYIGGVGFLRVREGDVEDSVNNRARTSWSGVLILFGLLTLAMYAKGFVRISLPHLYLAIIPSLLLFAVLYDHRFSFSRVTRIAIVVMTWLMVLGGSWSTLRYFRDLRLYHASVPEEIFRVARGTQPTIREAWCRLENSATKGLCFLPDDGHIRAIEFVDSHTRPDQKLFVGVTKHDRIFANDNLTYFASQRLPGTRWSHFDPMLQNTYEIQKEMVGELEVNAPPYIVRDSELDQVREPNDSSKSTGVTLLDDYLDRKYRLVETYGEMSIWQRIPTQ